MREFVKSEAMLKRAERVIPLGSQTFSKSRTQFPVGVSPLFMDRASGCRLWDIDGNEYIDFISSLCAVTLGYSDPDVDGAVREQLGRGVIFSLPGKLEAEVAELICEMVPCAERVRFGKNGSDATAGAIRLARAFTGRDRVALCGYHGWQDWYIGTTARNLGVPSATSSLSHPFMYNDLDSLERLLLDNLDGFAAIILEPMNLEFPKTGFLEGVRELADRHSAVLIFDETITGFRYSNGGAQQYFGVVPDLATFGKGLANGYPVSAIAGRADIMQMMEDVFFSFTFGGELLSLAAAKATLEKLKREPITDKIAATGHTIMAGTRAAIDASDMRHVLDIKGHPSWSFLTIADQPNASAFEIKTWLMQEWHQRGILSYGSHNVSYCHGDSEVSTLLNAYNSMLSELRQLLETDSLSRALRCPPLQPLFKVR